ncbi:MAG: hypothetical protein ABIH23_29395 [bacterium]
MDRLFQFVNRRSFIFFLLPFVVYMGNFREVSNMGDTTPAVFTAVSLVTDGDVYLDELHDYIPYNKLPYYLSERRGHVVSNYPILPGVLSVPVFLPGVLFNLISPELGDPSWRFFAKCAGAVFTSLSVLMMFLTLRRLTTIAGASVVALAYAFGTACWPISGQGLWQHGPSCFCWTLLLYALVRGQELSGRSLYRWLALAGLSAGLAVGCRLVSLAPLLLVPVAVVFRWKVRGLGWYLCAFLSLVILLLAYNLYFFGTWNGGLSVVLDQRWDLDRVEGGVWETPVLMGIAGNLVSPSRGLLIFSPFLVFSFWGMKRVWEEENSALHFYRWFVWIPLIFLLIFAKYTVWWGGNAHYGPRYQIEMLPVLLFFLGLGWTRFSTQRRWVALFVVLLVFAVFVQWIGAFCYPSDWASKPVPISEDKSRLWDWSYNQILTCLRSGIKPRLY